MTKKADSHSFKSLESILGRNGWLYIRDKECLEEFQYYQMTFQTYYCRATVRALFPKSESGEDEWDFSLVSFEVQSAEDAGPFFHSDVVGGMLQACEFAEDNLLTIGIPFNNHYYFHGSNAEDKKCRNTALRKEYGLDNI